MGIDNLKTKDRTIIKPFEEQDLKIYAYTLPEIPNHNGCIKVGETTRLVEDRISEQTKTVGLTANILFTRKAKKVTGEWFHDKDLHRYFILNNIKKIDFGTGADEWFYFNGNPEQCEKLTDNFIANDYETVGIDENKFDYVLRDEQLKAVEKTIEYKKNPINGTEFLWNAKPRFGKTLTTYDLIRKLKAKNVLIVTNRPAIANSWWDDFNKFIAWQEPKLKFISDTDSLKEKVMTKSEYDLFVLSLDVKERENYGCVAFVSLQDLKGAKIFGGSYDKLNWIAETKWDLLIIDEAHEGVDTFKSDKAFEIINADFTLHLSGTPFKAIANNKFTGKQIYNWSYIDEQMAKLNWDDSKDTNPYASLPTLSLFTYQMSKMIRDEIGQGIELSEENNVDYAFDLNEFFKTKQNGNFIYEESVKKFLDNLTKNKFPFAKSQYRHMLNHTFWLLPGVASCKAMEKLLRNHCFFKDYEVILAAGDGQSLVDDEIDKSIEENSEDIKGNEKSFDKVKKAIRENEKTITLSCGQLTTGVTIKEWTAVFMLSNIKSPSLYFQAAFRSQNPYEFKDSVTGELFMKENAYIFDFAPERTLNLFDEFANNLSVSGTNGTSAERKENIRELLNFFPVIAEDETGTMHEISASEVLSIPSQIKSKEVVKQGFMSNLLFTNIAAIFKAPTEIKEILDKIRPEKNKRLGNKKSINITDPMIDDNGEVNIPKDIVINKTEEIFGNKIYDKSSFFYNVDRKDENKNDAEIFSKYIINDLDDGFNKMKETFEIKEKQVEKLKGQLQKELKDKIGFIVDTTNQNLNDIEYKYENDIENCITEEEKENKKGELEKRKEEIEKEKTDKIYEIFKNAVTDAVAIEMKKQEEKKKKATEDEVRNHLRGFARTIPAFLMAYGDRETTLANFDEKIDEPTFKELTSITLDDFRILRDGMIIKDEESGKEREVEGLFDSVVFDTAVQEFMDLKEKLANYLDEKNSEDIFDYIPPQKTNQIFTPKSVVKMMVDSLEEKNSNIFKDPNKKFIDLYTKSGLYMTEIIKRLNKGLKKQIPNDKKRIKHIMENQVYGCAPSDIIYNMVKKYVYSGFDYVDNQNLIKVDLSKVAETGKIRNELLKERGKDLKFDVIIGNPPYQEADANTAKASAKPIYQYFVYGSKKLNPDIISLIIPSVWFNGGKGLDSFRQEMLNDKRIQSIYNFITPQDVFPNVNLRGGVNYFIWKEKFDNKKNGVRVVNIKDGKIIDEGTRVMRLDNVDIFIPDNKGVNIIQKLIKNNFISLDENNENMLIHYISMRNAFGFDTKFRYSSLFTKDPVQKNPVGIYASGQELGYIEKDSIKKNKKWINRWKVLTPFANNIGTDLPDDNLNTIISKPGTIATETYLVIGADLNLNKTSANNLAKYLKTKFVRFLISIAKANQNGTAKTYKFVPLQDFTKNSDIDWSASIDEIDDKLFTNYKLSPEEYEHIKKSIKSMS